MLSAARRLRRYVQTNGARETLRAILRRTRELAYMDERLIVCVKDLDAIVEPWGGGSELRIVDLDERRMADLAELNRARGRPAVQRLFARYLERGFHCFLAYSADELVGYYWWVDRDVPARFTDDRKLGLGLDLDDTDVYGSHFFVLEEHRGGGRATTFLYLAESALRDRGYKRIWGYVASTNRPARWVYSTRGYTAEWVIRLRRIALIRRTTREPT